LQSLDTLLDFTDTLLAAQARQASTLPDAVFVL
jgi:hypothetical protein